MSMMKYATIPIAIVTVKGEYISRNASSKNTNDTTEHPKTTKIFPKRREISVIRPEGPMRSEWRLMR